jgi:hypothetical protein
VVHPDLGTGHSGSGTLPEKLEAAHLLIARAGFTINSALSRRRFSLTALREALAQSRTATAALEKLVEEHAPENDT